MLEKLSLLAENSALVLPKTLSQAGFGSGSTIPNPKPGGLGSGTNPPIDKHGIINPVLPPGVGTGPGEPEIGNIVSAVIGILLIFGAILALLHFMLGAHKWITSSGDKSRLEAAREQITQALVGLLIMASVWAVMQLVSTFLGFDLFKLEVPRI